MAEKEKKQSVQTIQTKTRVEKGKSSIASVIFGRTGIIILLILLQFGFLIAGYTYLQGKMYFIDSVVKAGAVILVIYLTNNRSNPAFKMVWMTIMLVAPGVWCVALYFCGVSGRSAVAQCKTGAHARNDEETLDTG